MPEQQKQQLKKLEQIPVEASVPPDANDEISAREELDLSAGKRAILWHQKMEFHLKQEIIEHKTEVGRLRHVEIEHAKLKQTRKLHRFVLTITGFALVIGGGVVSSFQWNGNPVAFAIGWVLILLGGLIQIPLNLID